MEEYNFTHWTTFNKEYFPADWHRVYDRLGDECEVRRVKWSSTVYTTNDQEQVLPKKKHFDEVCIVWIVKQRC